jgi:hypothetical protein
VLTGGPVCTAQAGPFLFLAPDPKHPLKETPT